MNNAHLLAAAAGLALCTLADAKPPKIERFTGELKEAVPVAIGKVKRVNGTIVLDGPMMPYTGASNRSAQIDAVAWDCYGRGPGTVAGTGYPGTNCPTICPAPFSPDTGWRYWFGSSYANPNTLDDVGEMNCPPGSPVDAMDFSWVLLSSPYPIAMIFFMYEDTLDGNCPDPAAFTPTGPGIVIDFGSVQMDGWWGNVRGLASLGMKTPSAHVNPATGFASGSYQWIMASSVTTTGITLYGSPCSQFLWGTGDATGEFNRPGTQGRMAYDDDNPTDLVFDPLLECYDYSYPCPNPLGKMVAFGYLRCPADFNNDGFVDGMDADAFNAAFESYNPTLQAPADLNGDCFVDGLDYDYFTAEFESPCP